MGSRGSLFIVEAAKANKIWVSLGYSELDLASLYTTQIMISPAGDVINHRRKIKAESEGRLFSRYFFSKGRLSW
jgi:cyanide hydratase